MKIIHITPDALETKPLDCANLVAIELVHLGTYCGLFHN